MNSFLAYVLNKKEHDEIDGSIKKLTKDDLPEGDVLIKVAYSSVNYKDAMTLKRDNKIASFYPLIPGIDLSGTVLESKSAKFHQGQKVIVTSYELGTAHHGGFSQLAQVPEKWVVPLPSELSLKQAMLFGTAGFTAALSILKLREAGLTKEAGPILVTGATGGVGSMSITMLASLGFTVVASTGKKECYDFLLSLGAKEVISRESLLENKKPLQKSKWAGVIDCVGGETLAQAIAQTKYGGVVAASGLTGGVNVPTTVFPFITRGVELKGIDSVQYPMSKRLKVWQFINETIPSLDKINEVTKIISLNEVQKSMEIVLAGKSIGRYVIDLSK
ncbi:quinone oxidoreductase [Bacillus sp. TS-2]|nr:quinone oxidoreductase [Bacillus sp. TS-2]